MNLVNNETIKYDFIFDYNIDITAHRGASHYAPENSMAAFRKAYEFNVPYIELDVHETKDGVLYVMHDGSLLRTTGLDQKDNKTLWSEIEPLYLQLVPNRQALTNIFSIYITCNYFIIEKRKNKSS